MILARYEKAHVLDLRALLRNEGKLSYSDAEEMADLITSRFTLFKFKGRKAANFWIRLTIPFYLLYYLLLVISIPIRWIISGSGTYQYESKPVQFLRKWQIKLGF